MTRCILLLLLPVIAAHIHAEVTSAKDLGFRVSSELKTLIQQKKYAEAEQLAKRQQPEDKVLLAWLKIRAGNVDEGLTLARQLYPVDLNAASAKQSILDLVTLVGDASTAEGIAMLESFLQNESLAQSDSLWLQLVGLYAESRTPERGESAADRLLLLNPAPDVLRKPLFDYSVALYKAEQPLLALKYYSELRQRVAETQIDPGFQLQFAHILTAAKKPLDALEIIDAIRTESKDYAKTNAALLLFASGLAYEKLGDIDSATREFTRIIAGGKSDPQFEQFATLAKTKIDNFKEDEAARNLTEKRDDSSTSTIQPPDAASRKQVWHWLLWLNLLLLGIGVAFLSYRRRRRLRER